jgi:cell shape-determining protein MreD
MSVLLAIPTLMVTLILQMVIVSRLPLIHGTADLVLLALVAWALQERARSAWAWALLAGLAVSFISALPLYAPVLIYLSVTAVARLLQRRVWQTPILALLVAVFVGTLVQHGISIAILNISGSPIGWQEGLSLVTVPSLLLNLGLALPVYTVIVDLSHWVYPESED